MFKRIFACTLILAAMFCMTGCGGDEKPAATNNTDPTPDKAVLAYAEMLTHGKTDNAAAAGFTDKEKTELGNAVVAGFVTSLAEVAPLNDKSVQAITKVYHEKFSKDMKFTATVKKDDAKNPVVEIKTTPMDSDAAIQAAGKNDEWIALVGMVGQLKADGATNDQLKANNDVQTAAVNALTKHINAIPLQSEKTLDVTCSQVKGSDGKMYWAPENPEALTTFITGQK